MLANLDNEVHFKKVFTDVDVFCAFVKDVLGIDMQITKVETEKVLPSKTGAVKFRMNIFAEDTVNNTVVEIQKVDYDYTYDRFTHYVSSDLDNIRCSKTYTSAKDIYIIVFITSAYRYRSTDKQGIFIKDDVLITDINPSAINGEIRDMQNHKLVILNSTYITADTPPAIRDWLNLIIESMKNSEIPQINTSKSAIVRAAQLAEDDDIDPEEVADAKIVEMRKETLARVELDAKKQVQEAQEKAKQEIQEAEKKAKEAQKESIINFLKMGTLSVKDIANAFGVTSAYVKQIETEME